MHDFCSILLYWIDSLSRTRLVEPQGQSLLELKSLSTWVFDDCEYGVDSVSLIASMSAFAFDYFVGGMYTHRTE